MTTIMHRNAKGIIAALLAFLLLACTPALAAPADAGRQAKEAKAGTNAAVVDEINEHLAVMNAEELAATLKLLRVRGLINAAYVDGTSKIDLMTGAVKGAIEAVGDPYSQYFDAHTLKEFMIEAKGVFGGVGMVLGMKDKRITVIAPIEGTPADRAGIASGDWIIAINGQTTKDMALDAAVSKIRGKEGTEVILTVGRTGQEPSDYTIVRDTIEIKTVAGKMLEGDIGYIRLTFFNENTGESFAAKLRELEGQGMKAAILDLRNNPGGILEESVKVAGQFIPRGPVVSVVTRDGSRRTSYAEPGGPRYPLVVLINGGSASASEIVAGAVQDTGAGTLVGTHSFGKGSVQNLVPLGDGTAIKLTVARYHTPKDRVIDGVGLEPDVLVVQPADARETGRDTQLERAIEVLREKL
ncbi:S41 family peptidase [Anaeroselena agilis]|uniref:S41 family peptidase n=1 Tax=Anaeroselena agilis TaxID=3063788 RepID=A0ABU3P051_9FIRM|nr:S41 family peptidase [Selenomonadales bacterium 4137-cl]